LKSHRLLFGQNISLVEERNFPSLVSEIADQPRQSVFFCNVHMLMQAQEDEDLARSMREAEWIFADGVPIVWLQRILFGKAAQVVRGYEMTLAICDRSAKNGEPVGFIGSTSGSIARMVSNLEKRYPGLEVVYQSSPPFVPGEVVTTNQDLEEIRRSEVKWLFIGLGCPKQEKWIAKYADELDCHLLGIGAAFDWLAGTVPKPPRWMENAGLAWLFRLMQDPHRLWYRYLKYNSKFIHQSLKLIVLKIHSQLTTDRVGK